MTRLWWMIPMGAFMIWCLIQFFRGGSPPSDDDGRDKDNAWDLGRIDDP